MASPMEIAMAAERGVSVAELRAQLTAASYPVGDVPVPVPVMIEVAAVLHQAGFPPVRSRADWERLVFAVRWLVVGGRS